MMMFIHRTVTIVFKEINNNWITDLCLVEVRDTQVLIFFFQIDNAVSYLEMTFITRAENWYIEIIISIYS